MLDVVDDEDDDDTAAAAAAESSIRIFVFCDGGKSVSTSLSDTPAANEISSIWLVFGVELKLEQIREKKLINRNTKKSDTRRKIFWERFIIPSWLYPGTLLFVA